MAKPRLFRTLLVLFALAVTVSLFAQSTGAIRGKVTASDGSVLPGVTVEASSNVLPQPRVTVTEVNGEYRLPALQPGVYTLTYTLSGMSTLTRKADVIVGQETPVDAKLGVAGVSESITVTAEATLVNKESTELESGLTSKQLAALPVAQDYRDLQKLIPGVQVTQDVTRGPSAGGSGQDNVYLLDGVNVTMPLFGVLVAEPNTQDVAQVNVVKGGAKAVDFERAGGFQIDTVSKSGTNKFTGEASFQTMRHGFVADQNGTQNLLYQQDRDWGTFNIGGPVVPDKVFFYGSYYRPSFTRSNASNLYGALPEYSRKRSEEFGKLTYTPTAAWLLNGSYRTSHDVETSSQFTSTQGPQTGTGFETRLKISILEGSWIINPKAFATFKWNDFKNPGGGHADFTSSAVPSLAAGAKLPINDLANSGRFIVPTLIAGNATQNAFVQPFIDQYGYTNSSGVKTGGGTLGFGQFALDNDSFFRKGEQLGFNYTLGTTISHDLHAGWQRNQESEDRFQTSNGWGVLTIPGGSSNCPASACGSLKPAFFIANFSPQTTGTIPSIHSEFHTDNIELNDTIHMNNWTFNVGAMASRDVLYGQGLTEANNYAGFVKSPGVKYTMHVIPFSQTIQPRLGATWAYNGQDTVYASFAQYNPSSNSDARAASWDRNLVQSINAYFDQTGTLMGVDPVGSSSGKLFNPGIKPRVIDEMMVGTAQQINSALSARIYTRYRKGTRFWEDTNNNARTAFGAGVPGVKQELYVPDLTAKLAAIGSGSTYVITALDGSFTKYYEATAESDWHSGNTFLRGSYTWSHYYGNFDQDNSSFNTANDAAIFIGSSNIGDGAGRQLWNFKYGDLRGDRRNIVKLIGTQAFAWHATAGAFWVYQSGQPYQLESFIPYSSLTTSTSDTNRYAEPAGRRKSPPHHQLDLKYTQNIPIFKSVNLVLIADMFNVYNKQTGYNYETRVGSLGTCTPTTIDPATKAPCPANYFTTGLSGSLAYLKAAPFAKSFYDPRRYQLTAKISF